MHLLHIIMSLLRCTGQELTGPERLRQVIHMCLDWLQRLLVGLWGTSIPSATTNGGDLHRKSPSLIT